MQINTEKIKRFQEGGQFAVYQPLPMMQPQAPAPQPKGGGQQEGEQGGLDKDIVKKLMGEGIANDVMSFSNSVNQAYKAYSELSDFERSTSRGQRYRDEMKGDLGALNMLMRNKKEFDQSIEKVKSQDAYGELAITARGLVVKNLKTGKLSEISHQDYASDLRKEDRNFQALTNAELINEREYNPLLVNDKHSINSLNSSAGMESVKKEITSVLANLGSDSKSDSKGFFANTADSEEIKRSARQIVGMSKEGIYKIDQMASNETNERQLKAAASAMWQNLSSSARSLLKARAVANGADPKSIESTALDYALSLLNPASKTASVSKSDAAYDTSLNKDPNAGTDKETGTYSYYESLATMAGNPNYMDVDLGSGDKLTALGSVSGPISENGKLVGQTSIRNTPGLKAVANFNNMYFGDNKVDVNFADAVVYNGDDVMNVALPAKRDANGGMKPDFDVIPTYNKVMKDIQSAPNKMAREKIINAAGFQMKPDGTPDVPTTNFIVFNGMVNDQALGTSNYNKRLVKQVDGNLEKQYEKAYRFDGHNADEKGKDLKPEEYDRWFGARWANPLDVLQGMVFIEAKQNPVAARFADQKDVSTAKSNNTIQGLNQTNIFSRPAQPTGVIDQFKLK